MVFFSKKPFAGNFHLTFSKTFKRNCQESTKLLIVSIYKEHEFIVHRSKKKNYDEYFREFLKKCEIMSMSVTAVIATGQFILNCLEPKQERRSPTKVIYVFSIILERSCLVQPHFYWK